MKEPMEFRKRKLAKQCGECSAEVVSILEQDETNEKKDDDEEKKEK